MKYPSLKNGYAKNTNEGKKTKKTPIQRGVKP